MVPRRRYGMPAYADANGKVVVFFQDAGKFKSRYSTLGFQDAASSIDGDMWAASFALVKWSPGRGEEDRRAGEEGGFLTHPWVRSRSGSP